VELRKIQEILEYEARLHGLNVEYVDPGNTLKACPIRGDELSPSPNGCRLMRCRRCGLEGGRDVVAVR
jgi:putative transposase